MLFLVSRDRGDWDTLAAEVDGSILSTEIAKGFVGSYVGLHTRIE